MAFLRLRPKEETEVIVITDSNFDELVWNSDKVWFLDFHSPWCGHCTRLERDWKQLAENNYDPNIKIGKVDISTNP